MTLILAADTATDLNTIALCEIDGEGVCHVRAESTCHGARLHAERIISTTQWVLGEGNAGLSDVDVLAVSNGPGSFTGLRIGVATWKGLAYATGKPLVGVPTLDAMARTACMQNGVVCPLIDARMGEVFGAVYEYTDGERRQLSEAKAAPVEEVLASLGGAVYLLGDGVDVYRTRIAAVLPEACYAPGWLAAPRAAAVAAEAAALLAAGADTDGAKVEPVYLRKPKVDMRGVSASAGSDTTS